MRHQDRTIDANACGLTLQNRNDSVSLAQPPILMFTDEPSKRGTVFAAEQASESPAQRWFRVLCAASATERVL